MKNEKYTNLTYPWHYENINTEIEGDRAVVITYNLEGDNENDKCLSIFIYHDNYEWVEITGELKKLHDFIVAAKCL